MIRNIAIFAAIVVALLVAIVLAGALTSRSERLVVESKRVESVAISDHEAAEAKARIAAQLGATSAAEETPALPITKQAVLDALKAKGFVLDEVARPKPIAGTTTYRIKDTPAGVTFIERDGRLRSLVAMVAPAGDKPGGERAHDFLEIVGETVAKISRDEARVATAQAMVDLGKEPLGPHRFIGYATNEVLVKATRMPDRGYTFTFFPAPKLGE